MAKDPENATIYKFLLKVAHELKRQGLVTEPMKARQVIYDMCAPKMKGNMGGASVSDNIQKFIDNPMTAEEEAKALRAILHSGLSTGTISPQILDKLDKIIGVSSGEDDKIELVDFRDAFPDIAESVRITTEILSQQASA